MVQGWFASGCVFPAVAMASPSASGLSAFMALLQAHQTHNPQTLNSKSKSAPLKT